MVPPAPGNVNQVTWSQLSNPGLRFREVWKAGEVWVLGIHLEQHNESQGNSSFHSVTAAVIGAKDEEEIYGRMNVIKGTNGIKSKSIKEVLKGEERRSPD